MRRQGGGFGLVMLLVVLVVIFFIAMNNFKSAAPAAIEVQKHNKARQAGHEVKPEEFAPAAAGAATTASADAWTPAPPARPNLSTMDQRTSQHSAQVSDALSQAN
jgi:hypothetical protein